MKYYEAGYSPPGDISLAKYKGMRNKSFDVKAHGGFFWILYQSSYSRQVLWDPIKQKDPNLVTTLESSGASQNRVRS